MNGTSAEFSGVCFRWLSVMGGPGMDQYFELHNGETAVSSPSYSCCAWAESEIRALLKPEKLATIFCGNVFIHLHFLLSPLDRGGRDFPVKWLSHSH